MIENILDYVAVKSAITVNPYKPPSYIKQLVAPAEVIKELLQERIGGLLQKLLCITYAGAQMFYKIHSYQNVIKQLVTPAQVIKELLQERIGGYSCRNSFV